MHGLYELDELLKSRKVMTIASVWNHGVWSAPVYYLYRSPGFYFFSSPSSRHILGATAPESSSFMPAASIFKDDASFKKIKGVQMVGRVEAVTKRNEALKGAVAYAAKFGIRGGKKKESFSGDDPDSGSDLNLDHAAFSGKHGNGMSPSDLLHFLQKQYRASFYKFVPVKMIYMDNTVRIGFKKEIKI